MKKRYAVDRIEEGFAVLVADRDGQIMNLPLSEYPLAENDVVDVTFGLGGKIRSVEKNEQEKQARLRRNADRLNALFQKGKENK